MRLKNPTIEHIGGRTVAAGSTLTALTMNTGDSNVVKTFNQIPGQGRPEAYICDAWAKVQAAGSFQIRPPRGHDTNNGFQPTIVTGDPFQYWPKGAFQPVQSGDTINVAGSGSATAGDFDLFAYMMYYNNQNGLQQTLLHWKELFSRQKNVALTIRNSITGGAGGGYTGEVAINTGSIYNLRNNTRYAIVGFEINTGCCSVVYKGPESAGLRIGGPANSTNKQVTREYFLEKSRYTDEKFIPVFDGANGAVWTIGVMCDENAGTFVIDTHLVELAY